MTIGVMLRDVLRSFFKKPVTELYPFVRKPVPLELRAELTWNAAKCSGCQLCIKDCPTGAIELLVLDKVNKRFVMRYHRDRCVYCAQCVQSCRFKCLDMTNEQWEHAALSKEPFVVHYGRDEDVQFLLEKAAKEGIEECPEQTTGSN
jgi:formate hydrogenlyase subunit 6/NADH:ubiquinone oxidoreductase subunit I